MSLIFQILAAPFFHTKITSLPHPQQAAFHLPGICLGTLAHIMIWKE